MNQERIKTILKKLEREEFHNKESMKFSLLAMFASLPNFINCIPVCIREMKYMLKGGIVFEYNVEKNDDITSTINKFKKNWDKILEANFIIINNFFNFVDVLIPLQSLLIEENKNLFSIIILEESGFITYKHFDDLQKFSLRTKINSFLYFDKITSLVKEYNKETLYLPIEEAFTKEELRQEINNVKKVIVPSDIMEVLKIIYRNLEELNEIKEDFEEQIILNKKRWEEILSILKSSAFLNGRNFINLSDVFILKKIVWINKSDIPKVSDIIYNAIKFIIDKNCVDIKIYSIAMVDLLIDMSKRFQLMKRNKLYEISNIDIVEWNSKFNKIKIKIIELKYYSRDFFDNQNKFFNIFIDEDDESKFLDLFKIDDKLIIDWYMKIKIIIKYVNNIKQANLQYGYN